MQKNRIIRSLTVAVLLTAAGRITHAEDAVLISRGRIQAVAIVTESLRAQTGPYAVPGRGDAYIDTALSELNTHLQRLGEGALEIIDVPDAAAVRTAAEQAAAGRTPLILAGADFDNPLLDALIKQIEPQARERDRLVYTGGDDANVHASVIEHGLDPESFALRVADGVVTLQGVSPKGALNGVYDLLEQLGFRWYMPGDFGRVDPAPNTRHALAAQTTLQIPSFTERLVNTQTPASDEWGQRMRIHALDWGIGHSMPNPDFDEYPDFFALRNGERRRGRWTCVSNPDYVAWMVDHYRTQFRENPDGPRRLSLMPPDGGSFCECDNCAALDAPVKTSLQTPRQSVTDRYIWFNNQVIERLEDEFPDLRAGFLIYAGLMDPPVRLAPHPKIYGSIAEIHVCRLHGPNNPNCPESDYLVWLMQEWGKHLAWFRNSGYWFNLADPGLPYMMISRMRDEIPIIHQHGSIGIRRSAARQWANEGPSLYLAMKLKWDVNTDVDALLDEFFERFYGPAADPMRRYTMLLDRTLYEADHHAGRSKDMVHIYHEAMRGEARDALREAQRRVGLRSGLLGRNLIAAQALEGDAQLYALRVEVAAKGWDYFEAYAEMIENRNRCDFIASMQAVEKARALIEDLTTNYEIPMLRTRAPSTSADRFFNRLWGHARITEAGYERVTNGNELVVGLDSTWDFLLEPHGIGERIGLYDPAKTGGNWQSMDTSYVWGNHGLRYYYGEAWYRQRITMPAEHEGRRIKLWFASIDNGGKVWLNGELLGTSPGSEFDLAAHGGSLASFEFDVTDVVRFGEENTIAIRAIRDRSNELGTGGLVGPVMFYAPAEDKTGDGKP